MIVKKKASFQSYRKRKFAAARRHRDVEAAQAAMARARRLRRRDAGRLRRAKAARDEVALAHQKGNFDKAAEARAQEPALADSDVEVQLWRGRDDCGGVMQDGFGGPKRRGTR
jgi:hypothetical protein